MNKQPPPRLLNTEDTLVVARGEVGVGGWVKQIKGIKRYKLPLMK